MSLFEYFSPENRLLLCTASAPETAAVLSGLGKADAVPGPFNAKHFEAFSILQTGVGKTNAAAAAAIELNSAAQQGRKYSAVLNLGIGGALAHELKLGMAVLSEACILADEGTPLATKNACDQSWRSLEDAGFAKLKFPSNKSAWWQFLSGLVDRTGPIATISTISGNLTLAQEYVDRTFAVAEAMEGASIAAVCDHFQIDFAELRTISNICGNSNREENPWDFGSALGRLKRLAASLID